MTGSATSRQGIVLVRPAFGRAGVFELPCAGPRCLPRTRPSAAQSGLSSPMRPGVRSHVDELGHGRGPVGGGIRRPGSSGVLWRCRRRCSSLGSRRTSFSRRLGTICPPPALTRMLARPQRTCAPLRARGVSLSALRPVSLWAVTGDLTTLLVSKEVIRLLCEARHNRLPGRYPFNLWEAPSVRSNSVCQVARLADVPDPSIVLSDQAV